MIRSFAWAFSFAMLGLVTGWFVLWTIMPATGPGPARDWRIYLSLAVVAAIPAVFLTRVALQREASDRTIARVHFQHTWLVYPLGLIATAGVGGSHVANFFLYPFWALIGVLLGNLLALTASARGAT